MKAKLLSIEGKKMKDIDLPKVFSAKIREDILKKVFEAEKMQQPYGSDPEGGKKHSASGIGRHLRHVWKSAYGHGRARTPRKVMWRRGSQFYWVGAEVSNTRGGRKAHPPKVAGTFKVKKINKKEGKLALDSAIAATAKEKLVSGRYMRLNDKKIESLPIVVESKLMSLKTQEFIKAVGNVLGELNIVAKKEKSIRAGKGKLRNRKYKSSQGALLVTGNDEAIKTKAIESTRVDDLGVGDLYPMGRVVIYTENAIKNLEESQ